MINYDNVSPAELLDTCIDRETLTPYQEITRTTWRVVIQRKNQHLMDRERHLRDRVVGDVNYDRQAMNARTNAWITIEHMLNIFHQDDYLRIVNEADLKRIYQICTIHLKCCRLHNQDSMRGNPVGMLTLELMDRFLNSVFSEAKYELAKVNDTDDARTRYNKQIGAIGTRDNNRDVSGVQRTGIFTEDDYNGDSFSQGLDDGLGDAGGELFDFGDDKWT